MIIFGITHISRCYHTSSTVNPAERIPHDFEGTPHDCVADSLTYTEIRPDLMLTPIVGAEEELFVDGSCFKDHLGNQAGFAVVRQNPNRWVPHIAL